MSKPTIRSEMLAHRDRLPAEIALSLSLEIQKRVISLPEYKAAFRLGLYSAFRNEVFTEVLFRQAVEDCKRVAYPRVQKGGMEFVEVSDRSDLQPGTFGIGEPTGSRTICIGDLDLVVVPGVAFDTQGHRLGYGKGYYDRVLHDVSEKTVLVGLCYEIQLIAAVPAEKHDIRMNLVATENHTFRCGP